MGKTNPRHDYRKARERLEDDYEEGTVIKSDYEAVTEFLDVLDEDKSSVNPGVNGNGEHHEGSSETRR